MRITAIATVVIVPQANPPKIRIAEVKVSASGEVEVGTGDFDFGEAIVQKAIARLFLRSISKKQYRIVGLLRQLQSGHLHRVFLKYCERGF
jgi:hypothetical protein